MIHSQDEINGKNRFPIDYHTSEKMVSNDDDNVSRVIGCHVIPKKPQQEQELTSCNEQGVERPDEITNEESALSSKQSQFLIHRSASLSEPHKPMCDDKAFRRWQSDHFDVIQLEAAKLEAAMVRMEEKIQKAKLLISNSNNGMNKFLSSNLKETKLVNSDNDKTKSSKEKRETLETVVLPKRREGRKPTTYTYGGRRKIDLNMSSSRLINYSSLDSRSEHSVNNHLVYAKNGNELPSYAKATETNSLFAKRKKAFQCSGFNSDDDMNEDKKRPITVPVRGMKRSVSLKDILDARNGNTASEDISLSVTLHPSTKFRAMPKSKIRSRN